jgi:hypothetical protein
VIVALVLFVTIYDKNRGDEVADVPAAAPVILLIVGGVCFIACGWFLIHDRRR